MLSNKKYVFYAQIKPYNLKLSLVFSVDSRIRHMQEFIEDTMKSFRAKYKVGRIEHKKTSSVLLPDYKIGEVLEDKDELVVYSVEYGLTKTTLPDKSFIEDIDKLYIGKKIKRDSKVVSRKDSADKKEVKTTKNDSDDDENENENEDENEDEEDDNNKKEETKKNNNKNKKKNIKSSKKKNDDNSSSSGDDKSQDINI